MNLYDFTFKQRKKPPKEPDVPIYSQWGESVQDQFSRLLGDSESKRIDFLDTYSNHEWVNVSTFDVSEASASIPWKLFSKKDPSKEITDHELLDILNRPNFFTTTHDFRFEIFAYNQLSGNSYTFMVGNNTTTSVSRQNSPQSLINLIPDQMSIERSRTRLIKQYIYTVDQDVTKFEPSEIIHTKRFNPKDMALGQSQIEPLKDTLLEDRNAKRWQAGLYKNSLVAGGVFSTEGPLSKGQKERLEKQLKDKYTGTGNTHKFLITESGTKYQQITMTPKDVEFLNQTKANREKVLAVFGEPPTIAGLENANFAESKIFEQIFWTKTVIPLVNRVIDTFNMQYIPLFDDSLFLQADTSGIQALHENFTDVVSMVHDLTPVVMTVNEGRRIISQQFGFDLPELKNGDILYIPVNMVPVDEVGSGGNE